MSLNFFLPTKILIDEDCVKKNSGLLSSLGKKALIVTGKHSARASGALQDVIESLASQSIEYVLFDKIESNPTIFIARKGAEFAKASGAQFIIGIGGGSPMDAAKAIALLSCQELSDDELFSGYYKADVLPLVLLPTTAGTGSEVTPSSILTNDKAQTKSCITTPLIFPKIAMIDAKYTMGLPINITINTAIDALSHAVEGMLAIKANTLIDLLATESISKIAGSFDKLLNGNLDAACRANLIYASTLAGMVIAHTGTTAVHAMGYSLTYFKHIDHGRANGLLLAAFFSFVEKQNPAVIRRLLDIMKLQNTAAFKKYLNLLLGEKEKIDKQEIGKFADIAIKAKNIANCSVVPNRQDLYNIYMESFE